MTRTAYACIAALAAVFLVGIADAHAVSLYSVDNVPDPGRREGIVLIGIDSGDTNSHLVVIQLNSEGRGAKKEPVTKQGKRRKSFKINLAGRPTGHFVTVLPRGLYQVIEVSYPYFDLPFRLDTNGQEEWQFVVEEGKTSYIGQLVLAEERSKSSVDVNLLNRLATAYEQINDEFAPLLARFPLISGNGSRDDFLEYVDSP